MPLRILELALPPRLRETLVASRVWISMNAPENSGACPTTPSARALGCFANFLDRAATPPGQEGRFAKRLAFLVPPGPPMSVEHCSQTLRTTLAHQVGQ